MRCFKDDAYVFSILGHNIGTILACRSANILDQAGKNLFNCLGIERKEIGFLKDALLEHDNVAAATLCGRDTKRAVLFFRQFAEASGLCLAVVLDFDSEDAAAVLGDCVFENVTVSESLTALISEDARFSYSKHEEIYKYLSQLFVNIGTMRLLNLQYGTENPESLRLCALAAADIAGITLKFKSYLGESEEEIFYSEDIFDGRFCSASLLLLAFAARCYGKDCSLRLDIIKGLKSFRIKAELCPRNGDWQGALEHLKNVALYNTGMSFSYETVGDGLEIRFVPFYADIGFEGVKEGEWRFSIVDFRNYF